LTPVILVIDEAVGAMASCRWERGTPMSFGRRRGGDKANGIADTVNGRAVVLASRGDFLERAMIMQIENGKLLNPGLIEGEGRMYMGTYSDFSWGAGGKGETHVKIIIAGDDE
jgi:hypothetical protein